MQLSFYDARISLVEWDDLWIKTSQNTSQLNNINTSTLKRRIAKLTSFTKSKCLENSKNAELEAEMKNQMIEDYKTSYLNSEADLLSLKQEIKEQVPKITSTAKILIL